MEIEDRGWRIANDREQLISLHDSIAEYSPEAKRILRANGCYFHRRRKGDSSGDSTNVVD
jgi:hypothetical protein